MPGQPYPAPAPDFFEDALDFIWQPDNDGQGIHLSADDPGGATNLGVTFQTWAGWQRLHKANAPLAVFRTLGKADFRPLYRSLFWNAVCASSFGAVGIQLFDAAVNCGPGHAAGFLQTVLDVQVDDEIGPLTIRVAQQTDQRALARALCTEREAFYASRPGAVYFAQGWDRRAEAARDLVLELLGVPRSVLLAPILTPTSMTADDLNAQEIASLGTVASPTALEASRA